MPRFQGLVVIVYALSGCASLPSAPAAETPTPRSRPKQQLPPPWSSHAAPAPPSPAEPEATEAGLRVVQTAERMIEEGRVVRGSCYRYIDAVFDTAGYRGWRRRTTVFRGPRNGPYANLDLIQPGDWLWIVNYPDQTPVGTHSVLFLGWEDRAAGYARVVSYVGRSENRPADVTTYDVTRTYSIQRPVDPDPSTTRRR